MADPHNAGWVEMLALSNDDLLNDYVQDIPISRERAGELRRQTRQGKAYPLFAGSATKGIGIEPRFMRLANISLLITPRSFSMNRYPAWCSK